MLGYQTGIVILGITVKDKVKSRIITIEKHEYAPLSGNFEPFIASVQQKFNLCHWFLKWKECEDYYGSFDLIWKKKIQGYWWWLLSLLLTEEEGSQCCQNTEGVLIVQGKVTEHLQGTTEVPLSNVPNPQICPLCIPHRVPKRDKAAEKNKMRKCIICTKKIFY